MTKEKKTKQWKSKSKKDNNENLEKITNKYVKICVK